MIKTQTETVETAYGSVDVELAECDSCGNRVRADETVPFEIGDREGVACEYCEDEGPMSFPEKVGVEHPSYTFVAFALLMPMGVLAMMTVFVGDDGVSNDEAAALLGMGLGGMLWTVVAVYLTTASAGLFPF